MLREGGGEQNNINQTCNRVQMSKVIKRQKKIFFAFSADGNVMEVKWQSNIFKENFLLYWNFFHVPHLWATNFAFINIKKNLNINASIYQNGKLQTCFGKTFREGPGTWVSFDQVLWTFPSIDNP